jgi:hypothetical protein
MNDCYQETRGPHTHIKGKKNLNWTGRLFSHQWEIN